MARTAVVAGLVALAQDAGVASATQDADATNGNILPFAPTASPPTFGAFQVVLAVTNGDSSSHSVIIRGSGYTGAASGAANSGIPAPGAIGNSFTQATLGDLSVAVAGGATEYIGPLTTDRFGQPNSTTGADMWIDWSAATDMTFSALLLPVDVI